MSGVKIDDYLKVLQSKYQVTADVENRTLNFNEVKKELDAGQMIQMDAYDQNETLPQGSEGNEGHALAIVGYILPADGDTAKHAPYYEVWNPWWGNTFYVSSKASYFNLEGTQYKWTRTWHNWHKVTTSETTKTAPVIAQQKVASAPNPETIKVKTLPQLSPKVPLYNPKTPNPTDYLFKDSPLPQSNVLKGLVSEMGSETKCTNFLTNTEYGYSESKNGGYFVRARIGSNKKTIEAGTLTTRFEKDVDQMKDYRKGLLASMTLSVVFAIAALVTGGASMLAITAFFAALGLGSASIGGVLHTINGFTDAATNALLTWREM